jgi:hypothetical protein
MFESFLMVKKEALTLIQTISKGFSIGRILSPAPLPYEMDEWVLLPKMLETVGRMK